MIFCDFKLNMFLKDFCLVLFLINASLVSCNGVNNVCRTYEAYFTDKENNPDCFYDPDVDANFEQRAENHGLSSERHDVRTEDGWILTTFRLKSSNGVYGKGVIFLQHGMITDATSFTGNGNKSIAFFLAKQGYDVWLGNLRGTDFSTHQILQRSDKNFWNFSYHEHGLYDLPANLKYISAKTKSKVFYIGHSMGATAMAIYLTMKPEEATKYVKHTTFLSGSYYMKNTQGIFGFNYVNNLYDLLMLVPNTNMHVFIATDSFERRMIRQFCLSSFENINICLGLLENVGGNQGYKMSPEKFLLALTAAKNQCYKQMLHYIQGIRSQDLRMFDYGPKENMIRYNSTRPPQYDLSKMSTDITWIYGAYDGIATKEDNLYTFNRYRKPNWDVYEIPYNHYNFLFDNKYVDKTIYPLLLGIINKCI